MISFGDFLDRKDKENASVARLLLNRRNEIHYRTICRELIDINER